MGKPTGTSQYLVSEHIRYEKRTRGTETSQYLQEKKSTEIPSVAASERGKALYVYQVVT